MRALCLTLLGVLLIVGCGASTSQQASTAKKTAPAPAVTPATEPEPAPAPTATQAAPAPATLPASLEAGEIRREALLKVISAGPGRFLQRVRVKRVLDDKGRFAGWQLVQVFPGEGDVSSPLRPGDTLLRVNGQSVERPEQFKSVWDSLALSSELVLTVRRGGQQSDVRYRIVTEPLPP
jgi:type II secretory pathway component PulC